jgi:hypothetical protein
MICLSSASNFASPRLLYRLLHPRSATQCLIYGCPASFPFEQHRSMVALGGFCPFLSHARKESTTLRLENWGASPAHRYPARTGRHAPSPAKTPHSGSPPTGLFSTNFLDERPVMEIKAFGFRSRNVGETKSGTRTSRQLLDQLNPTKRAHPLVP